MMLAWTTLAAAAALVPTVTAFYPYHPKYKAEDDGLWRRFYPYVPKYEDEEIGQIDTRRSLTLPLRRVRIQSRANNFPVVDSADPKQENSVAIDQDGNDWQYMAAVTIGSSKEQYYMLLDTASSYSWVMGEGCTSAACRVHNLFGDGDSDTLEVDPETFNITYGTGAVSGTTAKDTVHIGPFSAALTFGLATNVSDDLNNYPMDGILALANYGTKSFKTLHIIDALAEAGAISSKIYGLHLSRVGDGKNDGEFNLGEVNKDRFDGDIEYYDSLDNDAGFWQIPLADAGAGDKMAGFTDKVAIIDSGTSYILMPPNDATALHKLIDLYGQSGESFTVPCNTTLELKLKFGDTTYAISPKDWVGGKALGDHCKSNIIGHAAFGDRWLVGDVFLKNVYSAYDLDNGKVGFGTKSGDSSDTETSSSSASASVSATASASVPSRPPSSTGNFNSSATSAAAPLLPPGATATQGGGSSEPTAGADSSGSPDGEGAGSYATVSTSLFSSCVALWLACVFV